MISTNDPVHVVWCIVKHSKETIEQLKNDADAHRFELEKAIKKAYEIHRCIDGDLFEDLCLVEEHVLEIMAMLQKVRRKCQDAQDVINEQWDKLENIRKKGSN